MRKELTAVVIAAFTLITAFSFGQATVLRKDKSYNKALQYFEADKIEKAIETINPLLVKYEQYPEIWDAALAIYLRQYQDALKNDALIASIQTAMDSAVSKEPGFKQITFTLPSQRYLNEFQDVCYTATLKTQQQKASTYLRILNVDPAVDMTVSKEAKNLFEKAEFSFSKKDFGNALSLYDQAIAINPEYYKANLYKGDTYFALKDYENAIVYYKKAINIQPILFEPRKYLTDAYICCRKYEEALDACIEGILIYPDESMFDKLHEIANGLGKNSNLHWTPRLYDVNNISKEQEVIEALPWKFYREAKGKISEYCDSVGLIIKSNNLTSQQLMEVYSWEEMLKNTNDPRFSFAKKMMEDQYLDCYAFISEFHFGIYQQYKIFTKDNSEKIRFYIKNYLIK